MGQVIFSWELRYFVYRFFSLTVSTLETVGQVIPLIVSRFSELNPASAGIVATSITSPARSLACQANEKRHDFLRDGKLVAWQASRLKPD